MFDIDVRVRVQGVKAAQDVLLVEKTCTHDQWAPREILCDRNYMEVNLLLAYSPNQAMVPFRYPEQWFLLGFR